MALRNFLGTPLRSDLYDFVLADTQNIVVSGAATPRDQALETWYFNANSMAVDNGTTVIRPSSIPSTDPGRYLIWAILADWNNISNKPTIPTINVVTRPINSTTFTPSSTKMARLYYNIRIACTATIGSAASGSVTLQYSTNSGSSWIDVASIENSNTVTLAITLNSVNVQSGVLCGEVPANALVRMVSASTGTTSITYIRGQEVY